MTSFVFVLGVTEQRSVRLWIDRNGLCEFKGEENEGGVGCREGFIDDASAWFGHPVEEPS